MKHKVQRRLLLVFGILVTSVLLAVFTIVWQATRDNFKRQISDQLEYTGNALARQYRENSESIMRETQLLSRDYGFRSAIGSGDQSTIDSALANFQQRISLDRMQVYDVDGNLLADTSGDRQSAASFVSMNNRPLTGSIMLGEEAYQVALAPVMAPDLIGWIMGGVHIDNTLAKAHGKLLPGNPDVSLFVRHVNGSMAVLGTTLSEKTSADAAGINVNTAGEEQQVVLAGKQYLARGYELGKMGQGQEIMASIYVSLDEAYAHLNRISLYFILVGVVGLMLVFAGAFLISRSFAKPIHKLACAAERIQAGDYSIAIPDDRDDEFGFLGNSFSQMACAIEEREHKIREQGLQDALTGLPNRLYIEDWLSGQLTADTGLTRVSVVLVCIDRLDEVNYVLGHDVADRVIAEVGTMLKNVVRSDDIITRTGTDTFGLAISGMQSDEVIFMVQRVLDLFKYPIRIDNYSIDVTSHVGIAEYPEHAGTARDLLRAAEHALFVARDEHERFAYYKPDRDSTGSEHLSLMGDLRDAIDRNELEVWYQPQVNADDGGFSRVEALVRWSHRERGMISPDTFIPLAERTGEIHRLTRWVLENSLIQIADWHARGLDLQVSVNLSARDLMNRELPTMISELLRKYGVMASSLCVEITESAIMGNTRNVITILQMLRDSGIQIAIDDFGTGYSSLEYLARLPVTELKIDRAFVQHLAEQRSDQVIVKSAIDLAHGLGLIVVTEGVENAQSVKILQQYGCDLLQGFLICKPKPAVELEVWYDSYLADAGKDLYVKEDSHGLHKELG